ncbi:LOW QUALITY PROTEIN: geraniol 8-hydroxylase-like [Prosopis cineraria]|uniref:LOW QUALITY PROTEIN: geraniol 8-hydroxylase-like n=1 Tax=Prosopis cineraria TaxID=364024 RepID=UPI00240FEFF5|nr:LOW QUALITY PROTEIN: geraniol 8-hydroxylase-like [Prosopis cineraria]
MISLKTLIQNLMDAITHLDFFSFVFLAFWGIFAVTWYAWLCFNKRDGSDTPPGPPGLPLIGNLLSLDPELHKYFTSLSQTYGPIFSLQLGSKYGVVVSSPSMARQVLKDHDVIFANGDVPVAGRVATYGGRDIVWTPHGSEWRMLRKVLVQWMLSNTNLDSVYVLRRKEVRKTVGYLYSRFGSPVDVGEQMFMTAFNVVTGMVWGGTVEGNERVTVGTEFREVVARVTELLGKPNLSDFFFGLARFDLQGVEKQMGLLAQQFDQIFEKMVNQQKRRNKDQSGNGEESIDFLDFLLKLKDDESSKIPLTMAHIKALLMDIVVGGTHTSANTIEFAMTEIMSNPDMMKRIQQELESVVGKNNVVEESHIHKLPYLHAILKETLRLYPVIPLLVPHCPSETTTIGGYTIPKGSRVFVNVWAIHRDPFVWDNPLHFDPSRFLDSRLDFRGNDFSYLPFGSGRRICAGIALAEKNLLYFVATLMHSFDWRVPQGQKLDISVKFGIVLKKRTPLIAIPTPRLSNQALHE